MGLSILDTEMKILDANAKSLKATSTILQNDLDKNSRIYAIITRFNTHVKQETAL
jgi:hypothetical protein